MPSCSRARVPGASCFFTLALADRSSSLLTDRIEDLCCAAEWPVTSIHRDIRLGRVDPDWAGSVVAGEFWE